MLLPCSVSVMHTAPPSPAEPSQAGRREESSDDWLRSSAAARFCLPREAILWQELPVWCQLLRGHPNTSAEQGSYASTATRQKMCPMTLRETAAGSSSPAERSPPPLIPPPLRQRAFAMRLHWSA